MRVALRVLRILGVIFIVAAIFWRFDPTIINRPDRIPPVGPIDPRLMLVHELRNRPEGLRALFYADSRLLFARMVYRY